MSELSYDNHPIYQPIIAIPLVSVYFFKSMGDFGRSFLAGLVFLIGASFFYAENGIGKEGGRRDLASEIGRIKEEPLSQPRRINEARLLFYQGRYAVLTDEERLRLHTDGGDAASWVLQASPENVPATVWWAANQGAIADLKRNIVSLKIVKDVERALLRVRDISPEYGYGAVDRALGKVYQKAPRWFSVGSARRAEECFRRALERYPNFPGNQLIMVDFLLEEGRRAEAKALFEKIKPEALDGAGYGEFAPDTWTWKESWQGFRQTLGNDS